MDNWKFNVMILAMIILAVCSTIIMVQYDTSRRDIQPRDVLAQLSQKILSVEEEVVTLRESVDHSKERAAEIAAETKVIIDALNKEIIELKAELRALNGKKQ